MVTASYLITLSGLIRVQMNCGTWGQCIYQAQYVLLNASRNELHNITSKDILYTLKKINSSLEDLGITVKNAINKLMQYQIECFTQVNVTACEIISYRWTNCIQASLYSTRLLDISNRQLTCRPFSTAKREHYCDEITREIDVPNSKIETAQRESIDKDAKVMASMNLTLTAAQLPGEELSLHTSQTILY